MNRVFVTGWGAISSLGMDSKSMMNGLLEGKTGVQQYPEWKEYKGLRSLLGAPAPNFDSKVIPRSVRRSMSRMSEMAFLATQDALKMAEIDVNTNDQDRTLIAMGSTTGSSSALRSYFKKFFEKGGPEGQLSTSFFKVMNHTVPANVALGLGFQGPLMSPSSACSSSSQCAAIGYEMIRAGVYDVVIIGGADELDPLSASIFDVALAASTKYNNKPEMAPRPFDKERDGLVVSEGAGVIVLESEDHLKKRSGVARAELAGAAYICDGTHMSQPRFDSMIRTMKKALGTITPNEINYVNAHATGTLVGDIEEARAITEVFGDQTPISSLKGHMGHSLAACGSLEMIACMEMMSCDKIIGTRNLESIDENCGRARLIKENIETGIDTVLSNNFAFGGMNTSVVIKKPVDV